MNYLMATILFVEWKSEFVGELLFNCCLLIEKLCFEIILQTQQWFFCGKFLSHPFLCGSGCGRTPTEAKGEFFHENYSLCRVKKFMCAGAACQLFFTNQDLILLL